MAGGGGGGGSAKAVPMHRLFAFADRRDAAMMAMGAAAAVANGLAMPFLPFIMGDLVDAFGTADRAGVVHVVSKVAVQFVYVAIASGVATFLREYQEHDIFISSLSDCILPPPTRNT